MPIFERWSVRGAPGPRLVVVAVVDGAGYCDRYVKVGGPHDHQTARRYCLNGGGLGQTYESMYTCLSSSGGRYRARLGRSGSRWGS